MVVGLNHQNTHGVPPSSLVTVCVGWSGKSELGLKLNVICTKSDEKFQIFAAWIFFWLSFQRSRSFAG
jgi:hypothetical protein